jgi:transposase
VAEQKMLFNEAEVLSAIEVADAVQAAPTTGISAHERKTHTGGRQAIPAHLPRKEILADLPDERKHCEHEGVCWAMECMGKECIGKECIGKEISERYHYEPPKVWVERQIRPKWACTRCLQGVHIVPCPPQILPKSNASTSLLAYLVASKFVDGLPIYGVCPQLKRRHVNLSPAYRKAAKVTELPSGKNLACMAIDEYIGKGYAIERHIKEVRDGEIRHNAAAGGGPEDPSGAIGAADAPRKGLSGVVRGRKKRRPSRRMSLRGRWIACEGNSWPLGPTSCGSPISLTWPSGRASSMSPL